LSFIKIKQPNLAELYRLRTRINAVNFVGIVQSTCPLGAINLVKSKFSKVLAAVDPHPIELKFGREGRTLPAKFHLDWCNMSSMQDEKSKNTGRAALWAVLPVKRANNRDKQVRQQNSEHTWTLEAVS